MISFPWTTAAFRHQPWGLEMIWFSCEAWQTEWRTARLAERCENPTPAKKTWRSCQRWWTKKIIGKWMDLYGFLYISLWHCPLNHFFCSLSHLRDAKKTVIIAVFPLFSYCLKVAGFGEQTLWWTLMCSQFHEGWGLLGHCHCHVLSSTSRLPGLSHVFPYQPISKVRSEPVSPKLRHFQLRTEVSSWSLHSLHFLHSLGLAWHWNLTSWCDLVARNDSTCGHLCLEHWTTSCFIQRKQEASPSITRPRKRRKSDAICILRAAVAPVQDSGVNCLLNGALWSSMTFQCCCNTSTEHTESNTHSHCHGNLNHEACWQTSQLATTP